ncbi:EAL and HDOD domain-containing protein [Hydrogenovibrio kuenenii]|uniref:EAL and HDOD domain-containing protein n=1 Tax=Hydrogenovibrio kuenenii TaxID=63658 RepID=UPI000463022B|nr:EAL domain-containing protein [Hydrogenovibrio kuenenii]
MSEVFIGRQPILDRNMEVFAYELQFHQGMNPSKQTIEATEELLKKTEAEIGFQSIVGKHAAMMALPKELIASEHLPVFEEGETLVLEIPNNVNHDVDILQRLKELKGTGSSIALDDYIEDDSSIKLASISDFAKIDNEAHTEIKLKRMIQDLHEKGVKVIAERVETEEMFHYLKKLGFDYFQGHFFTNPVIINGEKLTGNKLNLLQLMAKINDPLTDYHQLSEILSQDVALSHKLLIAVNNPMTMIPVRVESISDALKYMGLKRLKFWVNMLLLADMGDAPQELLVTSLIRARFCELLAEKSGHNSEKDSYFLVGLLSSLGAFFRTPIQYVVDEMPLSGTIKTALVDKRGLMGKALEVLHNLECTSEKYADLRYENLGISEIGNIYLTSSAWAQEAIAH